MIFFNLGGVVDILGPYAFSIIKAMSASCVPATELGKINALLSAIESLLPAGIGQVYATIWKVLTLTELVLCLILKAILLFRQPVQPFQELASYCQLEFQLLPFP